MPILALDHALDRLETVAAELARITKRRCVEAELPSVSRN
jgi:hypothetical protein